MFVSQPESIIREFDDGEFEREEFDTISKLKQLAVEKSMEEPHEELQENPSEEYSEGEEGVEEEEFEPKDDEWVSYCNATTVLNLHYYYFSKKKTKHFFW